MSQSGYPVRYALGLQRDELAQCAYATVLLEHNGSSVPGLIDVLYQAGENLFTVQTGGLSENTNSIRRKEISASIIKNDIIVGGNINTKVLVLNPNPTNTPETAREGRIAISFLDVTGYCVRQIEEKVQAGQMKIYDAAELLGNGNTPVFYTMTAHANFNVFPITFVYANRKPSGAEHSQPPFVYTNSGPGGPRKMTVNAFVILADRCRRGLQGIYEKNFSHR